MKLNANQMAINLSSFGVPTCGHGAFATTGAFGTGAAFGTTRVVRERKAVMADMDLAIAYVPGTSAWSPPTS